MRKCEGNTASGKTLASEAVMAAIGFLHMSHQIKLTCLWVSQVLSGVIFLPEVTGGVLLILLFFHSHDIAEILQEVMVFLLNFCSSCSAYTIAARTSAKFLFEDRLQGL